MSNDTMPAKIKVFVYRQEIPFFESIGEVLRVSDHQQEGVEQSTWYNADLVDALIEKIKALPVEHWVQEGPHGEPVLVGYVMQAQGEWDAVNEAVDAIQEGE